MFGIRAKIVWQQMVHKILPGLLGSLETQSPGRYLYCVVFQDRNNPPAGNIVSRRHFLLRQRRVAYLTSAPNADYKPHLSFSFHLHDCFHGFPKTGDIQMQIKTIVVSSSLNCTTMCSFLLQKEKKVSFSI